MRRLRLKHAPRIAALAFLWILTTTDGRAQDDPFGAGPAAKPAPAGADPKAKTAEPDETDPVVLSLRESNPTTPEELTRATRMMLDFGRPDEAKRYLMKLAASAPDDATWVRLHAKNGSSTFLRWINAKDIQPEGATIGRQAMMAVQKLAQDPQRLQDLVRQLSDPSQANRNDARIAIRDAGLAAVAPLVRALSDPRRSAEHVAVQSALASLGSQAIEPLVGTLASEDPALRQLVIEVLTELKARRATPYLVRPALDESGDPALRATARASLEQIVGEAPRLHEAEMFLTRRIRGCFQGELPVRLRGDDTAELWIWDTKQRVPVVQSYPAHDVAIIEATRMASELYQLSPSSAEHRRLFLMTQLEEAKVFGGVDRPLPRGAGSVAERAGKFGPIVLEDLLAYCIKQNRPLAAAAVAEVLGDVGTEDLLVSTGGAPRPLAAALAHADRRLRFAATEAILKIDPKQSFPGASYLAEGLGFFAGSVGARRVLVAHPRIEDAQTLVGYLRELGFEADQAQTGRGAFSRAIKQSDYEFVLLSDSLDRPNPTELIQTLRQDPRTATLPIGILAELARGEVPTGTDSPKSQYRDATRPPLDPLLRAERMAEGDSRTEAFPRPYDVEGMRFLIGRLQSSAGRDAVTREERLNQAAMALDWIATLAEGNAKYGFYEIIRQQSTVEGALQTPELATRAARALAVFGSARAQTALVDLAGARQRSVVEREAAVNAFRAAVQRRGLMLTREEILRQYDRYNENPAADADSERILGAVLDAIELPSRAANTAPSTTNSNPNPTSSKTNNSNPGGEATAP